MSEAEKAEAREKLREIVRKGDMRTGGISPCRTPTKTDIDITSEILQKMNKKKEEKRPTIIYVPRNTGGITTCRQYGTGGITSCRPVYGIEIPSFEESVLGKLLENAPEEVREKAKRITGP